MAARVEGFDQVMYVHLVLQEHNVKKTQQLLNSKAW